MDDHTKKASVKDSPHQQQALRDKVAKDTEAYLKKGGTIKGDKQ